MSSEREKLGDLRVRMLDSLPKISVYSSRKIIMRRLNLPEDNLDAGEEIKKMLMMIDEAAEEFPMEDTDDATGYDIGYKTDEINAWFKKWFGEQKEAKP